MNKYLIFASDERSYLDLVNVVLELKKRNLPYFFLYSKSPHRISPTHQLEQFSYDSNVEFSKDVYPSQTLGFNLPFKPNILLITNENWEPEKSVMLEFKQWGCFIGCVEGTSYIYGGIKGKLEIASRKSFPTNCVDTFFDHSEWAKETKTLEGWFSLKSVVTGNPRNDSIDYKCTEEDIIIVYGSMEKEHHYNLLKIYKNLKSKLNNWEIYYKPHPSETKDFPNDFTNIQLLQSHNEFIDILKKSKHNVGIFSSVMYFPLILNKNVVQVDLKTSGQEDEFNLENYRGHEFNFWSNILGFSTFEDFVQFIGVDFLSSMKKRVEKFEKNLLNNLVLYEKDCTFTHKKSKNIKVLKYFDEFNDQKASKRIIDYIENE